METVGIGLVDLNAWKLYFLKTLLYCYLIFLGYIDNNLDQEILKEILSAMELMKVMI